MAYSKIGLTSVVYAIDLIEQQYLLKFLLIKCSILVALLTIVVICVSHERVLASCIPKMSSLLSKWNIQE